MATKLLHPQIPTSHMFLPPIPTLGKKMITKAQKPTSINHPIHRSSIQPKSKFAIKVSEQSSSLVGDQEEEDEMATENPPVDYSTITRVKTDIDKILQGINRGIFGIPNEKKSKIEDLVKMMESLNPNPYPTLDLDKLGGCWKLKYSTITILGSKRTKLGLRDFISLGDFLQVIDVAKGKAVNVIMFNVRGLNIFSGKLVIEASFKISSRSRVDICYNTSTIVPDKLMNMFRKNFDILLEIFNPNGWLEITYVDETLRIGRDDKGNVFILERTNETGL